MRMLKEQNDGNDDIVTNLYKYINGEMSAYDLEESDDFIDDVKRYWSKDETLIVTKLTIEEFLKDKLDLKDDDIWMYNEMTSYYSNFSFQDRYNVESDFSEGYYSYDRFDEENLESLKLISSYVFPEGTFDIENREYLTNLNERLTSALPELTEKLIQILWEKDEDVFEKSTKEKIQRQEKIIENKMGITLNYDRVCFSVADLIMMSAYLDYSGNLEGLVDKIILKFSNLTYGGWGDYYNNYNYNYFDLDSFNREVSFAFEDAIELIEEQGIDYNEFTKFVGRITKISPIGVWNFLPKKKTIKFRVVSFSPENMKVRVDILSRNGVSSRNLTEEGFYNLLYHPELFEI